MWPDAWGKGGLIGGELCHAGKVRQLRDTVRRKITANGMRYGLGVRCSGSAPLGVLVVMCE